VRGPFRGSLELLQSAAAPEPIRPRTGRSPTTTTTTREPALAKSDEVGRTDMVA